MRNGNIVMRLAKLAPAPRATKTAGKAQQMSVEDDANNEKKFDVLSLMPTLPIKTKPLKSVILLRFDHWQVFFS